MGRGHSTGDIDVTSLGWPIAVTGRLEYGEWETADGAKRSGRQVFGHVEVLAAPEDQRRLGGDAAPVHWRPR